MMNNYGLYKWFIGITYGQSWWSTKVSMWFGQYFAMFYDHMDHQGTLCCDSFSDVKISDSEYDFLECIQSNTPFDKNLLE